MGLGKKTLMYHNGRGRSGERLMGAEIAESDGLYRGPGLLGNQLYMLRRFCRLNLNRELQMEAKAPTGTQRKKAVAPLWVFENAKFAP